MRKIKKNVYDLSRINEWWLLSVGMILFAFVPHTYVRNNNALSQEILLAMFSSPEFLLSLAVVFGAQIFLFASNDYFDRHVDALDPRKRKRNPVCNGNVKLSGVRVVLVVSCLITFIASAYFGFRTFLFTALAMFVFYFYTAPPLRLKNKVGLDVLSHALFVNTFPYFFCLVALDDFSPGTTYLLTAIMLRSAMAQIFQEVRDYHIDRQVERNTAVVLGQRRALWAVLVLFMALFALTGGLLVSYQVWGWGIDLYYVIILILCFTYMPIFYKLMSSKDPGRSIERLWMGQGRTNRWQVVQYFCSFALYTAIMIYLWCTGYF